MGKSKNKVVFIPHIVPHKDNVPDLEEVMEIIALRSEFHATYGMVSTYKLFIGAAETRILFQIEKKEY